jgi:hypothetical protein
VPRNPWLETSSLQEVDENSKELYPVRLAETGGPDSKSENNSDIALDPHVA